MTNKTLKIALVVMISIAVAGVAVPYLRRNLSKNTMDYLTAICSLVCGSYLLVVSYVNGRRTESERRVSKLVPTSGILVVLISMALLIMKVFGLY
jgi:predicted membrane-bound dolichyl-phosphate-mannose-protein mannosyltransferase